MLMTLAEKNFDQILDEHEYVVVDFWAERCVPCRSFKKTLVQVEPNYPEFIFGEVNVDEEKTLAEDFDIRSVPFVMIIRKRVIVYADSGVLTATALVDLLDQAKSLNSEE